jgi:hypothetical protein
VLKVISRSSILDRNDGLGACACALAERAGGPAAISSPSCRLREDATPDDWRLFGDSHPSSIGVRLAALTRILCVSRIAPVRISTALATLFGTMDTLFLVRFRLTLDFFVFILRDFAMYFLL